MPPSITQGLLLVLFLTSCPASGFGFFDATGEGFTAGSRWDAAPRTMDGVEQSLNGGLRFSLQGGSYQAFRDLLSWQGTPPTVAEFEQAVLDAFAVWTSTDPVTGLDTVLRFVPDLATPVSTTRTANFVRLGAEIDLFAATNGDNWNPGNTGTRAEASFNSVPVPGDLTLSSGVAGYAGYAISGVDITFNSNTGARYTLTTFGTLLTHEIGHALGLADVDLTSGPAGYFIDDNYDNSSGATIVATLNNSFALLIDPANPGASPLQRYTILNKKPGFDTTGVDILMESAIPAIFFESVGAYLTADDVAGRQFLYPVTLQPTLSIALDGGDVVLSWPEAVGWSPRRSSTLEAESWTAVSTATSLQGNTRVLRLPRSLDLEFYRLERFSP